MDLVTKILGGGRRYPGTGPEYGGRRTAPVAVATDQSYADLFANAKPASSSFQATSAQIGRGVSEKSLSAEPKSMNRQSGADNFGAPVGVQGSTASAGMVKQVVATAQADGSLVQNQATSAQIGRGVSEKSLMPNRRV